MSEVAHYVSHARSVPPGFRHTEFGDYWVLREDGGSPAGAAHGESIRPASFLALQDAWDLLARGHARAGDPVAIAAASAVLLPIS